MTLEQTTELYASVLRQLLPAGGYDTSPNTEGLAVDIYAHAKLLAQADLDAKRLLNVLEGIPSELLPEFEAEYGLPLKCTVNASKTIEERIELLKWVRSTRNVLNKAYLEQILAIFGVVLIDIVKFKPLLCTAACDSPVNTEQLRYKVFLRLQYPMNADMSCIVENYLPGYLRIEWMIDMPWGNWILNPSVTVNTNGIAHYTAYKTNQREYYDSYANLDLTAAIVRSLADADMQQWQAVKDAIQQLTGVNTWTFDNPNSQIKYTPALPPFSGYAFRLHADPYWNSDAYYRETPEEVIADFYTYIANENAKSTGSKFVYSNVRLAKNSSNSFELQYDGYVEEPDGYRYNFCNRSSTGYCTTYIGSKEIPTVAPGEQSLSYNAIAQKIISNASSSNQAISLLAEAYLEAVANSIFNTDTSKQFVKLSNLLSQFELNKTLRT